MVFGIFIGVLVCVFFDIPLYFLFVLSAIVQAYSAYSICRSPFTALLVGAITVPFLGDQLIVPMLFDSADIGSFPLTFTDITLLISIVVLVGATGAKMFNRVAPLNRGDSANT